MMDLYCIIHDELAASVYNPLMSMGALYIDEFAILFMKYAKGHVNINIWKTEYSRYNLCCSMVGETAYKQQQKSDLFVKIN